MLGECVRSDASNSIFPHFSPIFTTYVAYPLGGTAKPGRITSVSACRRATAQADDPTVSVRSVATDRETCERSEARTLDLIEIT